MLHYKGVLYLEGRNMNERNVLLERFLYSYNRLPRWKQVVICYKMELQALWCQLKNTRLKIFLYLNGFDKYYKDEHR